MTLTQIPQYITVKQAAEISQRHSVTITLALQDGELHGTQRKKHATWRIRQDCLEAWIEGAPCAHATAKKLAA